MTHEPFKPRHKELGYRKVGGKMWYFILNHAGKVLSFTADELQKKEAMLEIVPDEAYWAAWLRRKMYS